MENDAGGAAPEVEAIELRHLEGGAVHFDPAGAADVHDAQLAPLAEEGGAQFGVGAEGEGLIERDGGADDGAIGLGVNQLEAGGGEEAVNKKSSAQGGRAEPGIFLEAGDERNCMVSTSYHCPGLGAMAVFAAKSETYFSQAA